MINDDRKYCILVMICKNKCVNNDKTTQCKLILFLCCMCIVLIIVLVIMNHKKDIEASILMHFVDLDLKLQNKMGWNPKRGREYKVLEGN